MCSHRDPERPTEPPEPSVALYCEGCGKEICVGDSFYKIPPYWDAYCEDCVDGWKEMAEGD